MLLHRRTADSIPVNDDLLRNSSSIDLFVIGQGILNKFLKLIGPVLAEPLFLLTL